MTTVRPTAAEWETILQWTGLIDYAIRRWFEELSVRWYDELYDAGLDALIYSVRRWRSDRGSGLKGFATTKIRWRLLSIAKRLLRLPTTTVAFRRSDRTPIDHREPAESGESPAAAVVRRWPERTRRAVNSVYLRGWSIEETARRMGRRPETIRQVVESAVADLVAVS